MAWVTSHDTHLGATEESKPHLEVARLRLAELRKALSTHTADYVPEPEAAKETL